MPDFRGGNTNTLPTNVTDANRHWVRIDSDTSSMHGEQPSLRQRLRVWQERVGHIIESRRAHLFILFLLTVDVACVIADLSYSFLSEDCVKRGDEPTWLTVLSHISLAVTTIFLVEIILALFAFGPRYYNPSGKIPLASLHLFDAVVIIASFILEVVLKGREEELAALLIILRFWRIVKLTEDVAVGAGELGGATAEELETTKQNLLRVQGELVVLQDEVHRLRQRLLAAGIEPDGHNSETQERRTSSSST